MTQSSCNPDFESINQGYTFHMPTIRLELRTSGSVFRQWIGLSLCGWFTRTGSRLQQLWIAVVPSLNLRIFDKFFDPLADVSIVKDLTYVGWRNGSKGDSISIREKTHERTSEIDQSQVGKSRQCDFSYHIVSGSVPKCQQSSELTGMRHCLLAGYRSLHQQSLFVVAGCCVNPFSVKKLRGLARTESTSYQRATTQARAFSKIVTVEGGSQKPYHAIF